MTEDEAAYEKLRMKREMLFENARHCQAYVGIPTGGTPAESLWKMSGAMMQEARQLTIEMGELLDEM